MKRSIETNLHTNVYTEQFQTEEDGLVNIKRHELTSGAGKRSSKKKSQQLQQPLKLKKKRYYNEDEKEEEEEKWNT